MLTDMGGVLGLWFGIMVMSFIEGAEFIVDMIVLSVVKLVRRMTVK